MRGVLDEVDEILSELTGDEGVRVIVLLPHWRLAYVHPPPIIFFFPINIYRVDGMYDNIVIILELELHILLWEFGFTLYIIFLGSGGFPIFLNVVIELPQKRRLPIYRRLSRIVTGVLLKIIPIIYGLVLVTTFIYLLLAIEDSIFLLAFNFFPVLMDCTQRGKEEVK